MAVLRVAISVSLDGAEWDHDHLVIVPPDYRRQDIEPFIRHEMDKAVAEMQRREFGEARSAEIIEQFDRRLIVIRHLIKTAPHRIRTALTARRVLEVIDLDRDELFARFGRSEDTGD